MEEVSNLTQDEVLEIVKNFPLEPPRSKAIITVNIDDVEEEGIEDSTSSLSDSQFVMAVGPNMTWVQPGQKIMLDLRAMMQSKAAMHNQMEENGQIMIDPVEVNGRQYIFIDERVIKAKDKR